MMTKLKKAALAVLGIGIASAAGLTALDKEAIEKQPIDYIAPITFNGEQIDFPYTDDNTGETLLIHTDRGTVVSWDKAYGYMAVKNISPDDQNVNIQCVHGGDSSCSALEEYKPQVAYQAEVQVLSKKEVCQITDELGKPKDVKCFYPVTGMTTETRYRDEWGSIIKSKTLTDYKSQEVKAIPSKFVAKDQFQYWIPAGATKYFRYKLTFNPDKQKKCEKDASLCQYYITAYGHLGAKGQLDPWYSASWTYRMQLTLDYTKVGTTTAITGFPVTLSTTTPNLKYTGSGGYVGKSDGTDMLITASDGTTKLPHEIEKYSSSTGETIIHFKTSTSTPLSTSTNTTYYIYYGNSGASDQQDIANVWDSNYTGVWHMKNSTGILITESTSNGYHLTKTASNQPYGTTGKIGIGQGIEYFDYASTSTAVNTSNTSLITWEGWVNSTSTFSGSSLFETYSGSGNYPLTIRTSSGGIVKGTVFGPSFTSVNSAAVNDGNWHHMSFVHDTTLLSVYTDGVLTATTSISSGSYANTNGYVQLEFRDTFVVDPDMYVDEFRFSNVARSAAWIKTSYNSQNSPGTFITWGAQETDTPASSAGYWIINVD